MERASSSTSAIEERTSRQLTPGGGIGGTEPARPPCRFFLLGKCKFGDSCTFSHEPQGRIPVCTFFEQTGSCRYGNSCKFLHNIPTAGVAEPGAREQEESVGELRSGGSRRTTARAGVASSAPNQTSASSSDSGECCGICLENIPASGKRFGLLNCDHVYCLECLRTWRKSRGPQKDISRTCPECRKVSFFLVPSKEHLKGRAKLKAIQAYKKGLSKLPCKYHKADGSTVCPFGVRCFYAHLDENGEDVKNQPPPAQPVTRRTCPYLRNRGRDGGVGGGSHSGGLAEVTSRGAGHGGFDEFYEPFPLSVGEEGILDSHDVRHGIPIIVFADAHGDHISIIMRLQQLMMLADDI